MKRAAFDTGVPFRAPTFACERVVFAHERVPGIVEARDLQVFIGVVAAHEGALAGGAGDLLHSVEGGQVEQLLVGTLFGLDQEQLGAGLIGGGGDLGEGHAHVALLLHLHTPTQPYQLWKE